MAIATRQRLDSLLVAQGHAPTRARARDAIIRGCVSLDGRILTKPGQNVASDAPVSVDDPLSGYVSRAAMKLIAGLDAAGISVAGRTAVDLGASTGGFTQVLLERGATHVAAVDVGYGQFDERLTGDARVRLLEGTNARNLTSDMLGFAPEIVVSDLSFISLRLGAEPALRLAAAGADAVLLVKPQFEVGREGVGKGGIVSDPAVAERAANALRDWLNGLPGWRATRLEPSPIHGSDGNREFLLCGRRDR